MGYFYKSDGLLGQKKKKKYIYIYIVIGPSSHQAPSLLELFYLIIITHIYIKKRQSLGALIWATISWYSWPVVDGQREIDQFFLHGITKLFNLTCCRLGG